MKLTLLTGKICDIKEILGFDIIINSKFKTRRLSLRIDSKKRLPVLSMPKFCSKKQAIDFVLAHKDWINEKLDGLGQAQKFEVGQKITILSQEYQIMIDTSLRAGAKIVDNQIVVACNEDLIHNRVVACIKSHAKKELLILSRQMAEKIGCKVKNVTIKDTKSRWGSCSSLGNINYNWRIALAPDFVFKSIVAHEVAHLLHRNHAKGFYDCLASLSIDYKKADAWLKINGRELYKY